MQIENLASNGKRIWSYAIDDLVTSALFIAIFFDGLKAIQTPEDATAFVADNYMVLVVLKVLYHTLFTWQNGKTLGKHLMKIRAVSIDIDRPITLPMALLRAMVRLLSEALFYIGFIPAFFSPLRQATHDKLPGIIVVND